MPIDPFNLNVPWRAPGWGKKLRSKAERRATAAKVRRYRARQRAGLAVLKVTVPEFAIVEFLIESGRLTVAEAIDRRRVEHAAAEVLAELAARWSAPKP